MTSMLVAMTIFACVANLYQVRYVQEHIETKDHFDPNLIREMLAPKGGETSAETFAYARWVTIASLENAAMESRYHQASVMFLSRIYIVFLGFATGMVLALVGASFILGKLREQATKMSADHPSAWRVSLTSNSPGLILAFLGTVLMVFTILTRAEVSVHDESMYIPALFAMPEVPAGIGTAHAASGAGSTPTRPVGRDAELDRLQHNKKKGDPK